MRLMVFCSNPVNGGTARIFYETVLGLMDAGIGEVFPCVNQGNSVEIYNYVPNINKLPINSEYELYEVYHGKNILFRIASKIKRLVGYRKEKKKNIKILSSFFTSNSIDAVLIHNGGYVGDDLCNQVLTAAYREKVPKRVYVLHNDMEKGLFSKLRYAMYDRFLDKCSTDIATVSKYTRDRIKKSSFIKKNIEIVYNGMSVKHIPDMHNALKTLEIDPKRRNILLIGNFTRNKGQDHFIKVAKMLLEHNRDTRFVIIGNDYDHSFYNECMKMICDYQLHDKIHIFNGINNASEYIKLFDVLCVTSLYDESFGLISLEAMSAGKPVVAFACGGIPEVVTNGRNGIIVPVGDDEKMADSINYLITDNHYYDITCKNNIKDYEERFSRIAMIKRYMELLC